MGYNPLLSGRGETDISSVVSDALSDPGRLGILFMKSKLDSMVGQGVGRIVVAVMLLAMLNGTLRALFPLLTDPHNYPWPSAP